VAAAASAVPELSTSDQTQQQVVEEVPMQLQQASPAAHVSSVLDDTELCLADLQLLHSDGGEPTALQPLVDLQATIDDCMASACSTTERMESAIDTALDNTGDMPSDRAKATREALRGNLLTTGKRTRKQY